MKKILLSATVLIILFISSCKKDAELDPEIYPVLLTENIEYASDSSLNVSAKVYGDLSNTVSYGFVWSTDKNKATPDQASKIEFKNLNSTEFQAEINYDLACGKTYYIRSYLIKNDFEVYGNLLEFNTDSLKSPWTKMANFGGEQRTGAVCFTIGVDAYVGLGYDYDLDEVFYHNDFWRYVPSSNTWTRMANFPGAQRAGAIGFSLNGFGYVGSGSNNANDLWKYDPANNSWSQVNNIPGENKSNAVCFTINNCIYIGTGSYDWNSFWKYDPALEEWSHIADFPGIKRKSAVAFTLYDKAYVGLGRSSNGGILNDFWEYDPGNDTWKSIASIPATGRYGSFAFSINNKGYIGTGKRYISNYQTEYFKDVWKYDPELDRWTAETDFADGVCRSGAVSFVINGIGYVAAGNYSNALNDLRKFTPTYSPY